MNSKVTLAEESDAASWNEYVKNNPAATIYHHFEISRLINRVFGHRTYYFKNVESNGKITGILPSVRVKSVLFGDYFVSLPYFNYGGVVADCSDTALSLMTKAASLASELGSSHFEFRHTVPVEQYGHIRTDKVAMLLDLPDDYDALLGSYKAKLRSQIRRSLKDGAEVQLGTNELVASFYRVFSENMRDLGTPVYSKRLFEEILSTPIFNAKIIVISVRGEPAAAAFVCHDGVTMEIPWASSLRKYNHISVNMLLYGEVLRYAIDQGCSVFDFGRSTKDSGTYRFKKQWGAEPVQLYWQYWLQNQNKMPNLSPENSKFSTAIAIWQRLPLPLANFIGPKVVKNLP